MGAGGSREGWRGLPWHGLVTLTPMSPGLPRDTGLRHGSHCSWVHGTAGGTPWVSAPLLYFSGTFFLPRREHNAPAPGRPEKSNSRFPCDGWQSSEGAPQASNQGGRCQGPGMGHWGAGGSGHSDPGPQREPRPPMWAHPAEGTHYGIDTIFHYCVRTCPLPSLPRTEAHKGRVSWST